MSGVSENWAETPSPLRLLRVFRDETGASAAGLLAFPIKEQHFKNLPSGGFRNMLPVLGFEDARACAYQRPPRSRRSKSGVKMSPEWAEFS